MHLCTNAIEFAPFGSEENRTTGIVTDNVPRWPPGSIYRLADKVCTWSPSLVRSVRYLTGFRHRTAPPC